ncbi:putative GABA permease [Pleurostoma richardsiae]|uniref:GABA permease n=1 Tax=Pleurostoma richardsiae TaxID=41990 RepID=A0AA38R909_9PEZI|nr:putative GABA permease [Pleurostoma richardsiae]
MYFSANACWEVVTASLYQAILAGGPTVLVWSYLLCAVGATCIACAFAEFASIWPTAGGQYHWAVHLAPARYKRQVGWFTAWLLLSRFTLALVGQIYTVVQSVQSMIIISITTYEAARWHSYLMFIAVLLLSGGVNIFVPRAIHHISIVGLVFHILGYFALSISLLATTKEFNSAKLVFGSILDSTGYNNKGVAFLIGMLPAANTFITIDGPAHYAEETSKPRTDVSRAISWGTALSSLIGLPYAIILGFTMGDPVALLTSPVNNLNPLAQVVLNNTGSRGAAIALSLPLLVVAFATTIESLGMVARIIMAQARDKAVPYSKFLCKIHHRHNSPANAVVVTMVLQIALAAIYVGNTTAFYGLTSSSVILQVISLLIPVTFHLLYRKKFKLSYGPWQVHRMVRPLVNIAGFVVFALIFVAMLLPTMKPVTAANMNYACVMLGAVLILIPAYWVVWGRKRYNGPLYMFSMSD